MTMLRKGWLAALAMLPVAVRGADGTEVTDLTQPTNKVEVGALYVNQDSAKFGEYNGLDKKGTYAIGNFELYGGNPDTAFRWKLYGFDLGLDTRTILGEVGEQGKWRVTAGYDEIPHRVSDQYMTIWNGSGSTSLTLPSGYPAASTRLSVTNTAGGLLANWNNIQSPNATATTTGGGPATVIPASMQQVDIGTERKRYMAGVSFALGPGWDFKAGVRREDKDGTKLTGANLGRFSGLSSLVAEPINSTTDLFDASVSYADEKLNFTVGYYGSIYKNDIGLWTIENPGANNAVMNNVGRFQSYPDNDMHQFNLNGGYRFSQTTRLIVTGSYARMTQNDDFIAAPAGSTWVVPSNSANAKVIQSLFSARLTSRPWKDVSLNASYKYDNRDNKTPVQTFLTTGGDSPGASTQFSNEPINRQLQQFNLDGEYALGRGQALRAEYEYQRIHRTADSEESPFRADTTYEDTLRFVYRKSMSDDLTGRISYAYSRRHVSDYEQGNPTPTNPPAPLPAADPALTGFEQFFLADRKRDKLRSQMNYQATDQLSIQGTLDYNRDRYDPQYGLKEARSWVFGLDAGMSATDNLSFNAFYTYEDMSQRQDSLAIARGTTASILVPHVSGPPCAPYTNAANTLPNDYFSDPCRQWSETQADKVHTLGVNAQYVGLMGGRLVLNADLSYSRATTPISVTGGTYYSNGVPNSATANVWVGASNFPDITSTLTDFRLGGTYALDKVSSVRIVYWYRRLKSEDWAYDAYSNSSLGVLAIQNYIGNGMTSPNYNVSTIGAAYTYRFR